MKVIGDVERVNLSTGNKYRRVVGNGESKLQINRGFVDVQRLGPSDEIKYGPREFEPTADEIVAIAKRILDERNRLMNATRCKMKLTSISDGYSNGLAIKFTPVTGGSEENKKFYAATPGGSFEFTVSEQASKSLGLDVAKIGSEFYVDITPAS